MALKMNESEFCPVSVDENGVVQVNSHALVKLVAEDDRTFSSATSRFLQVPNGMDGRWHTAFRALIDRYMTPLKVSELQPETKEIARSTVSSFHPSNEPIDAVELGAAFAVRASSAWLGWPQSLEPELLRWVHANWEASRTGELERTAEVARWYNEIIASLLHYRREHSVDDVTSQLMRDKTLGRYLTDEELTSILRNWTGGDLGSMALCVGVVIAYLADNRALQQRLRSGVSDTEWQAVLDEILRLDDPFLANRRVSTRDTKVGDEEVSAGQRLRLNWTEANVDPEVFGESRFDPAGHAEQNLVYGIGRHVCPGRTLATMQLQEIIAAILAATVSIEVDEASPRVRSEPPAGGYSSVPVVFR